MLAAIAFLALLVQRPATPVERAQKIVASDARFATARQSGFALLKVAQLLRQQAESCRVKDPTSRNCADLFSARPGAGAAVSVLNCTRPGAFDTRQRVSAYLDQLQLHAHPHVPAVVSA